MSTEITNNAVVHTRGDTLRSKVDNSGNISTTKL